MEPHTDGTSHATPEVAPMPSDTQRRRSIVGLLVTAIVAIVIGSVGVVYFLFLPMRAHTLDTHKVYRVGIFSALAYFDPTIDAFREKMAELGYVEGKNITYEIQKSPSPVGNQALLKKFVDSHVDLILVYPTDASIEAKEVTAGTGIPVVSTAIATEGNSLVASLQKPGGNVTGVRFPIPEITAKRLEVLHEIAPDATRIWVPYLQGYPTVPIALEAIRPIAQRLNLTIIDAPFSTPDELVAYLAAHETDAGMDAILTIPEPLSIIPPYIDPIYAFADAHHIPIAGADTLDDASGPVFSLIPEAKTFGELAAPLADKIFRGISPGEIPVVTPDPVFVINVKAIHRLGLTVSEALLSTADRIIH